MLTGNQLIQTIQDNSNLSKSDLLRVTGYTSVRKDGSIKLKIIKPEGKNIMSGEEFLRGRPHLVNTSLS